MIVKRFFEPKLAQASYLIGCGATGEALVIDPNRDVEPYIKAAEAEGVRITHVTETHIHADYLSGSRELAARTGATLHLSDEGDKDWKYGFMNDPHTVPARHGDRFKVGNIAIDVVHTPGHTPEHLTFLITDGAVADEPIAAATGDFIFVGDVGRPDLLERAANMKGTMEIGGRALYGSLQKFLRHPDWLQIWPGHGAGSACGKGISAIPHSTLGYEKRFNWAFQTESERDFVALVLAGQPEPPAYFAMMKKLNKEGPRILGGFPKPPRLEPTKLSELLAAGALVVDMRKASDFAVGHVPGTINIPLNGSFTTWAGWLVPYTADFYLIADQPETISTAVRDLAMIGLDRVAGYFDASALEVWATSGRPFGTIPQLEPVDLVESLRHGRVALIDVRSSAEWRSGHIHGARHVPLGYLLDHVGDLRKDMAVVVQCQSGARSSIGASLLRARGFTQVINLSGGFSNWLKAGLPTVTEQDPVSAG